MNTQNLPLSPHATIYRWPITAILSITHRATGVFLSLGSLLLAYWLLALAMGPEAYACAQAILSSLPGRLILFLWTACFYFHLCNGVRHLVWDVGVGLEVESLGRSGIAVLVTAAVLTLATWWMALSSGGAA